MKVIVNHCKNLKIYLTVTFQNATEMVSRLLNSRSRKILLQFAGSMQQEKTMLLILLQHIFWYIWDRRAHKRKTETAHDSPHCHAYAAKLFGLFFLSLFPGQNADHSSIAWQTENNNCYLLLWRDGTLT